jgi:hypothetical protein
MEIAGRSRRWRLVAMIAVLAVLAGSCGGEAANRSSGVTSPSNTAALTSASPTPDFTPTPVDGEETPEPSVQAGPVEPGLGRHPLILGDDAARLIGSHRTMARGHIQGVGDWNVFLYPEGERAGVGLQIGDATPTRGCCLTRLRSAAEPLAFIPLGGNDGLLLVHIDADIDRVRFDCVQCDDARGVISHIAYGRVFHVPQLAVLFIRANAEGGNDGTVVAIGLGRVDQDWVGLPPHCTVPKCPKGLAWGSLQRGVTRTFDP